MNRPASTADYTVSAVDRALSLMVALADNPGLGVSELAEVTGCTKSLVFRLLYTLERRGFVQKDAERSTYTLGWKTMILGDRARRQSQLIAAAEPFMKELSAETGENVLLLVRDGHHCICVALKASREPQKIFAEIGRRVPLHTGGGPKILLAHAPDEVRDAVLDGELPAYTAKTITDTQALAEVLKTIRRDGWTRSSGELDGDKASIGAPVRMAGGEVVAALSVTGSAQRIAGDSAIEIRDAVINAAHLLSVALGHQGAPVLAS